MAIVWFNWWKFLHLVGLAGFLIMHGVSILVLNRIGRVDLDRVRITQLISLSGQTTMPMYLSLAVLLAGGIGAGLTIHAFWQLWLTVSIVILVVTVGLMTSIAAPYFKQITAACEVRPSGVPRKSDEELGALLDSPKRTLINVIGAVGLLSILYLMIFKPWL
jgi:cytochrome bd-type quinol oxidase subunit 2